MNLPAVVSATEWQAARDELLAKEKEATRASDALAAARRRLPRVQIEKAYVLEGPAGDASLLDLFEGRRQLIVYHFMFGPNQEVGCDGCSIVVEDTVAREGRLDLIFNNAGIAVFADARDTSLAVVSRAPLAKIEQYRKRMGWTVPWYSSFGSDFNVDFGVSPEVPQPEKYQDGESFGLSVFIRDGDNVYRTYFTNSRGVETLGTIWTFLDVTPLGRQENWEDSPDGYPQTPPYQWWRRHDEYEDA